MAEVIDAHHHLWDLARPFDYRWLDAPALSAIRRDFLPEDLVPHLRQTGVDRTIVVQTQHDLRENLWALALADQHEFIAGVVGWVDLKGPECESQVLLMKECPKFVGVRHVTQDEPDDDFIVRDDVLRGLGVLEKHGVPFDLLFYVKHLKHAVTLAERFPSLPMVIDHLAKPRIKDQAFDDWEPAFRAAGRYPNVFCKLSGMATEASWDHWTADDLTPYVRIAFDVFGPERLMFGSDWPVCELAGTYEEVYEALHCALGAISASERAMIFGETAARFYGLS